jgi:hypothetical protein
MTEVLISLNFLTDSGVAQQKNQRRLKPPCARLEALRFQIASSL